MALLQMKNISKSFGANNVLNGVNFEIDKGEIHALLGENGAGKSTLMNILTGVIPCDTGTIVFDGKTYNDPTIQQMEKAGIAFVHQELNVINDLTVADNIFLCREIHKGPFLDKKAMIEKTKQLFSDLGVNMNPEVMVSELKTAEKQLLEICRTLYVDAKLLILDEPTTALSNDEIDHLFSILMNLKAQGKSFIFISHKMPEIFAIADKYTVLRNGEFVSSGNIKDTNPQDVTSDMVGAHFNDEDVYEERQLGEIVLDVKKACGQGFENVNLYARKGEVIAFTGLAGSGASELMQAIFGAIHLDSGSIKVLGKELSGNIMKHMKDDVGMLPANRKENSVIPDMTILDNFSLAQFSISGKKPFINYGDEVEKYGVQKASLNIKAEDCDFNIGSLSGGNQQKVFLGRWLNTGADLLLFDNPTQGVDVGAKAEIYKLILGFAKEGKTVIINTLEIPEIKKVADRCLVFYEGQIVKEFKHNEVNEKDVMLYSTNAING